ncbi:MAG: hypothetical protein MI975_12155 [Cytophagales bacterium]|nr:hypothetical protein [Cytophagales bacterium]
MLRKLQSFFNPERFQGWGKRKKYFEGWYYKAINKEETKAFAIIPGIAIDDTGEKLAFIQILDGKSRTSEYIRFPGQSFNAKSETLELDIDKNKFTEFSIELNLSHVKGRLDFEGNVPWPKPFYSPGIMGPYAFVPFMECYHGIVSMDHSISGTLQVNGEKIDFKEGRGYIEKDWGRSFPSAYTWMQSNHFNAQGISIKASVAKIPWIRNAFVGFIAGFWFDNALYRFTTYNRTRLVKCSINRELVEILFENKKYLLHILAKRDHATELASPILGVMDGRIEESMTSSIEVELTDKRSKSTIFHDTGRNAGLEVAGKIDEIIV